MTIEAHDLESQPSLLYAVKQVELAVRSHLDDVLRPSGITVAQYTALTVLQRRDGLTSAELARNSFVTTQTMADLVTALLRQKLIDRRRDPHDGRRVLISLTERGTALVAEHEEAVQELERRMVASLTKTQVASFGRALNACREALGDAPAH